MEKRPESGKVGNPESGAFVERHVFRKSKDPIRVGDAEFGERPAREYRGENAIALLQARDARTHFFNDAGAVLALGVEGESGKLWI